jgi:lipopolysaccharide biosynthesis protein
VFFLEEFRIRGAAAFTNFLSDGCEELLCPLEYGMAAGISRTGIAQQGFESLGSGIEVTLIFQQARFSA